MKLKQVTRTQIAGIAMVCALLVGGVAMGTTVLAQDSDASESEPNDGFSEADSVQLGTTFSGTVSDDDTRDLILVEGIEPGQNVTIEATAGDGEVNVAPELGFVDPGTTKQGSTVVEEPPLLVTVDESFDQDGVTSSDYTIRVTAAGPGGTPTETPEETPTATPPEEPTEETTTEAPTEEPTEETTTEAPTEEPTEETTTEAPTEETEDGDDGKAKQPSDDDAAANGGNGKAKMGDGDDSSDDGDAASNGKAKMGDGDDSDEAANSGNGKAKVGDSEETTTETETDTNEDTSTEAETDSETDLATDASGDLNCEDFPTKDLAQQNLDNNPDDPNGLDADSDGEACDAGVDA